MTAPTARRGDVWFAEMPGDKRRPVLVLTRDPLGAVLHAVVCAPITSTIRGLATEVAMGAGAGLAHDSVANFDNVVLVERSRLIRRLGRADQETLEAACQALTAMAGC